MLFVISEFFRCDADQKNGIDGVRCYAAEMTVLEYCLLAIEELYRAYLKARFFLNFSSDRPNKLFTLKYPPSNKPPFSFYGLIRAFAEEEFFIVDNYCVHARNRNGIQNLFVEGGRNVDAGLFAVHECW